MFDLRSLQLVQLEMLSTFDDLCKKLGLRYSLAYGTLLGAVRHKGFIPWDDDVDVCMSRRDYDELIKRAAQYLPGNYFLQSAYSDPGYPLDFAKLLLTDYSLSVAETRNLDISHGVFIDIFPIDACDNRRFVDWLDRVKVAAARVFCYATMCEQFESGFPRRQIRRIAAMVVKRTGTQPFVKYSDNVKRKRNTRRNTYSYFYYTGDSPLKYEWGKRLPIAILDDLTEMEFEGRLFSCVCDYDRVLTAAYGDYMKLPPADHRVPRHELLQVSQHDSE